MSVTGKTVSDVCPTVRSAMSCSSAVSPLLRRGPQCSLEVGTVGEVYPGGLGYVRDGGMTAGVLGGHMQVPNLPPTMLGGQYAPH